ncbi:MAG: hypothetical protein IJM73_03775, partial [Spirochaetales bacterium]|nr:hypothetical protein [Spirochaetales bacterium]
MSDRIHEKRPRNYGRENTFRAFLAIDIEEQARHELSRIAGLLKGQCRGSYPSSDMYHMTLAFLGDITFAQEEALCRVLEGVAERFQPFELRLCRLGYFAQPET